MGSNSARGARAKGRASTPEKVPATVERIEKVLAGAKPRSLVFAEKGIATSADFAGLMSAMMSDVIEGRLTPQISNAAVNAGGKLLKAIEMQHKYGGTGSAGPKPLTLVAPAA